MRRLYLVTKWPNLSGTAWEEHPTIRSDKFFVVTRPEMRGEYVNLHKDACFPLFVEDVDTDFESNLKKELN